MKLLPILMFLLTLIPIFARAQDTAAPPAQAPVTQQGFGPIAEPTMTPDEQLQFEDTHLIGAETGFFGIRYTLNGKEITSDQELEKIIFAEADAECIKDLKDSEDRHSLGWVLIGGGSGMLTVGVFSNWNHANTVMFNVLTLAGLGTDILGGMLVRESQAEQLNAVNRYNQLVRQDNGLSLLPLDNRQMGLAFVQRF